MSVKRDCDMMYGLWDGRVAGWIPDYWRLGSSRRFVLDHKKKEIYHGKRKEISTGHHIYG